MATPHPTQTLSLTGTTQEHPKVGNKATKLKRLVFNNLFKFCKFRNYAQPRTPYPDPHPPKQFNIYTFSTFS